jgi:hypothetical protein
VSDFTAQGVKDPDFLRVCYLVISKKGMFVPRFGIKTYIILHLGFSYNVLQIYVGT